MENGPQGVSAAAPFFYIGIDPGPVSGYACLLRGDEAQAFSIAGSGADALAYLPMPIGRDWGHVTMAVVEQQGGRPNMKGVNKLMQHYGEICGFLRAKCVPFVVVTPIVWQNAMGCRTRGDKKVSLTYVRRRFPNAEATEKSADSFIIAEYARLRHLRGHPEDANRKGGAEPAPKTTKKGPSEGGR